VIEPPVPSPPGEDCDAELNRVDCKNAAPPGVDLGKFHCRPEPLCRDASQSDSNNDEKIHAGIIADDFIIPLIDKTL
jgi:hypothetical protein